MASFHEVRFPADISFKTKGGPEFRTDIVLLSSGHEKRNISWENARARYELNYKDITKNQSKEVISFFMARRGKANGFRFKDWNDFEAKDQIIATGDGIKTQFQLIKNYGEETYKYQRKIYKPIGSSVLLFVGTTQQSGNFSVNATNGIITFSVPPQNALDIKASFQFDVPVRFNTDFLDSEVEGYGKNSVNKIELIEIKL
jgi:uncharacterized protein (TIGR02217 family)